MRKELDTIEKIEGYLEGSLPQDSRIEFEQEMAADPVLREQVRLQQLLMEGLDRTAWSQKIQQAKRRYHRGRFFRRWGTAGMGIVLLSLALLYTHRHPAAAPPPVKLPEQAFTLNGSRDTVIETPAGIVFSIPAGCFLDDAGKPVQGPLTLVVQEALDPAAIMRAGLSTRSGGGLLETGGMFYLNALREGRPLRIDPTRGVYAEIPTDTIRPGMELYTGRLSPDGIIDWVNPRPLETDLVPVDITGLDFYPPHYLDSLRRWGYDADNKSFTDSLYFSLAARAGYGSDSAYIPCGIDPAKVKTIWGPRFQNTLLSTREFEARMPWIHRTLDERILDLYVDHLDKPLYQVDSMAANVLLPGSPLKDQFLRFAGRHDGRVRIGSTAYRRLRDYYRTKARLFREAVTKTENEYWSYQDRLNEETTSRALEHGRDSAWRAAQNFEQELTLNFKSVCRQAGIGSELPKESYRVTLTNTGWCNIDRAAATATVTRTSIDAIDPQTGRKVSIRYAPFSIRVDASYERVYVYLLPDSLNSYVRLSSAGGAYSESLNASIGYGLVCIAYKGTQAYLYEEKRLRSTDYGLIRPVPVGDSALTRRLNAWYRDGSLQQENKFQKGEWIDEKRRSRNEKLRDLQTRLTRMLFPCVLLEM
ncbi:hypothetical protein [Dinghuibacter silviterrae]|uniref:Uncharacterized protein n=1 Tax=Dinghuibacter silviterrae TaxID=1539049 RepID=A0A4R8DNX4_9BACT|nr:hypothetical protein [Dinghuibacter silviterrae]TDW99518.1 hypothetical protein EDB95_0528 [Dinghuibacter silviterrae]